MLKNCEGESVVGTDVLKMRRPPSPKSFQDNLTKVLLMNTLIVSVSQSSPCGFLEPMIYPLIVFGSSF